MLPSESPTKSRSLTSKDLNTGSRLPDLPRPRRPGTDAPNALDHHDASGPRPLRSCPAHRQTRPRPRHVNPTDRALPNPRARDQIDRRHTPTVADRKGAIVVDDRVTPNVSQRGIDPARRSARLSSQLTRPFSTRSANNSPEEYGMRTVLPEIAGTATQQRGHLANALVVPEPCAVFRHKANARFSMVISSRSSA